MAVARSGHRTSARSPSPPGARAWARPRRMMRRKLRLRRLQRVSSPGSIVAVMRDLDAVNATIKWVAVVLQVIGIILLLLGVVVVRSWLERATGAAAEAARGLKRWWALRVESSGAGGTIGEVARSGAHALPPTSRSRATLRPQRWHATESIGKPSPTENGLRTWMTSSNP